MPSRALSSSRRPSLNTGRTARDYKPQQTRDLDAEISAIAGRKPRSVTESARGALPKAAPQNPWQVLAGGGSQALDEMVKQQQRDEQAEADRKTRDAQAEYDEFLRQRGHGGSNAPAVSLDEELEREEEQEHGEQHQENGNDSPFKDAGIRQRGVAELEAEVAQLRAALTAQSRPDLMLGAGAPTPAAPQTPEYEMRAVTVSDVDRLWDWMRNDPDSGKHFFGLHIQTSPALHQFAQTVVGGERTGVSYLRSLYYQGQHHLGFVALLPVLQKENAALLHCFCAPEYRGRLAELFPLAIQAARNLVGPKTTLMIYTTHPVDVFERMLRPFGFVPETLFVQRGT